MNFKIARKPFKFCGACHKVLFADSTIKQLLADVYTVLYLADCKQSWHKFCSDAMHVNLFSQICVATLISTSFAHLNVGLNILILPTCHTSSS